MPPAPARQMGGSLALPCAPTTLTGQLAVDVGRAGACPNPIGRRSARFKDGSPRTGHATFSALLGRPPRGTILARRLSARVAHALSSPPRAPVGRCFPRRRTARAAAGARHAETSPRGRGDRAAVGCLLATTRWGACARPRGGFGFACRVFGWMSESSSLISDVRDQANTPPQS